jgi:glyoxylate utilization-related uncharacterized protein
VTLEPGEKMGMYYREKGQEAFLVLAGECTLIVEGQERRLAAWDFFYCAPETEHIIEGERARSNRLGSAARFQPDRGPLRPNGVAAKRRCLRPTAARPRCEPFAAHLLRRSHPIGLGALGDDPLSAAR